MSAKKTEQIEQPERRNRFDKGIGVELTVSSLEESNNIQEESTQENPEHVATVNKTTIKDSKVETETTIIKKNQSAFMALKNLKSNELISNIVKKSREKDELTELMETFPNMNKNEIVNLFVEEILKQREKEIRRKMMGYKQKKTRSFKESKETFSMPVRPEMKHLLNIISLFSGSNKYLFFEDFIIYACKSFDFEAEIEELD